MFETDLLPVMAPTLTYLPTVDDLIKRCHNYASKLQFSKSELASSTFPNYASYVHMYIRMYANFALSYSTRRCQEGPVTARNDHCYSSIHTSGRVLTTWLSCIPVDLVSNHGRTTGNCSTNGRICAIVSLWLCWRQILVVWLDTCLVK